MDNLKKLNIEKDISLKNYSNIKTGGKAKFFVEVKTVNQLINVVYFWKSHQKTLGRLMILSGGTNVLFSDKGFNGLIIHLDLQKVEYLNNNFIFAESGVLVSKLIKLSLNRKLSGLEWASGLPGTIGGAVRGNAGAFGEEIKDSVSTVVALNIKQKEIVFSVYSNRDCRFNYRTSFFKKENKKVLSYIIIGVYLKLKKSSNLFLSKKIVTDNFNYRKNHHPMEYPTLGSTFKNIPLKKVSKKVQEEFKTVIKNDPFPLIPVASVLNKTNLRSFKIGDIQFAKKHPNFLINLGNGKSKDAIKLIKFAQKSVKNKYNVLIEPEIEVID